MGRPRTGITPLMGFRADPATRAAIVIDELGEDRQARLAADETLARTKPDIQRSRSPIHAQNHSIGSTFHTAWATSGCEQSQQSGLYSITSSVRASSVAGPACLRCLLCTASDRDSAALQYVAKGPGCVKSPTDAMILRVNRRSGALDVRLRGGD